MSQVVVPRNQVLRVAIVTRDNALEEAAIVAEAEIGDFDDFRSQAARDIAENIRALKRTS